MAKKKLYVDPDDPNDDTPICGGPVGEPDGFGGVIGHDWEFEYVHPHNGQYYWKCKWCGISDWLSRESDEPSPSWHADRECKRECKREPLRNGRIASYLETVESRLRALIKAKYKSQQPKPPCRRRP